MTVRVFLNQYERTCVQCGAPYVTGNRASRYCGGQCRTAAGHSRRRIQKTSDWLTRPRVCGVCSNTFYCTRETGPSKKYCSAKCSIAARAKYHSFWMSGRPTVMAAYNRSRVKKYGHDVLINRLRKRYPDLPSACESCGEVRVLDVAHKPDHKRNGAWRTMDQYERHMFWILCPTCHRVLDHRLETPEQMGLVT